MEQNLWVRIAYFFSHEWDGEDMSKTMELSIADLRLINDIRIENIRLQQQRKRIRKEIVDEFAEKLNKKITDFVLEHQSQLTFVSGVSMGWKFAEEIAEQLKEE